MSETKDLHVFTNGCEWWVGESVESVLRQQREDCGLAEEDQDHQAAQVALHPASAHL